MENKKSTSSFIDSFNCAVEGLIYVFKTQRNMRIHLILSFLAIIAGVIFRLDGIDFLFVCLAILLVLIAEVLNTAIELQIDLISETYHPLAKIIKDICAGAVLLASIFAILVAYLIIAKKFDNPIQIGIDKIKYSDWHISFICLLVVVFLTILIKLILHRGTPFYGGMPSAHAAVAFGIWVLVTLISSSTMVSFLSFVGASMVAQSRIVLKAHSVLEVLVGAALGSLVTLLVYQIVYQI